MKSILSWILTVPAGVIFIQAQRQYAEKPVLQKLDSIRNSISISKHFADLYFSSAFLLDSHASASSQDIKQFLHRMETPFSNLFFESAEAEKNKNEIQQAWINYYSDTGRSVLQLKLLGVNAHINGDLWQVLCKEFTYEELKQNKPNYTAFNAFLGRTYNQLFKEAIFQEKRIAGLHRLTLGFDRLYGKLMLKRWRNRQFSLAILYYENPRRFGKRREIIQKKKQRIDRFIIRMLR